MNRSHIKDASFILLQGNGVLFVGVLHSTNKVLDGFPNHVTSIHIKHHKRGRFRPNSTNTLAYLGKNLLKSGEATTKRCHIRIIIVVAEAVVGHIWTNRVRSSCPSIGSECGSQGRGHKVGSRPRHPRRSTDRLKNDFPAGGGYPQPPSPYPRVLCVDRSPTMPSKNPSTTLTPGGGGGVVVPPVGSP